MPPDIKLIMGLCWSDEEVPCGACGSTDYDYVFYQIRGRGKYDGRVLCENCLSQKLLSALANS